MCYDHVPHFWESDLSLVFVPNYLTNVLPRSPGPSEQVCPDVVLTSLGTGGWGAATSGRFLWGHLLLPDEILELHPLPSFQCLWNILLAHLPMVAGIAFIMLVTFFKIL